MIPIHIAIAPSTATEPEPDPVFFFAGGPGQAASETWVMIRGTLNKIREKRDIVMIDQRGTGQSNKLACPIDEGAISTNLCHYANTSSREGDALLAIDPQTGKYTDKRIMKKYWCRNYEKGWAPEQI